MAVPWLAALKAIPWTTILRQAPAVVQAADALLTQTRRRQADTEASGETQLLKQRLAELDSRDKQNAEIVKQLADQVQALAAATEVIAARVRALLVAAAAVGAALVAILLAYMLR
ncbi:MAG: hypothetical protein FJY54_17420 [Betaproteobacteria bacterium]|nr:hypothetical protein [Betaproteobacteria bacterium]